MDLDQKSQLAAASSSSSAAASGAPVVGSAAAAAVIAAAAAVAAGGVEPPRIHANEYTNPAKSVNKEKEVEDAQQLKFGADFQEPRCLWNAEVAIILKHRLDMMEKPDSDVQTTPAALKMINDTNEYVKLFKNYKNSEAIAAARKSCENKNLHPFEIAIINNLNIETPEEATTLIPTLAKKFPDGEHELEEFLEALKRHQST